MIEMASWKAKAEIICYKLNHNLYSLKSNLLLLQTGGIGGSTHHLSPGDGLSGGEIWHGVF